MEQLPLHTTPLHRFITADSFHFRCIPLTEKNFKEPDVAHRHGYWTVFVFLKGSGRHLIDFKDLDIKPGTIHFVLPGQIHALNGGKKIEAFAIMFTEEFFTMDEETSILLMRLFGYMDAGEPALLHMPKDEQKYFENLLSMMQTEINIKQSNRGKILLNLLSILIHKCIQIMALPKPSQAVNETDLYIRFRKKVEENYKLNHSVAFYANALDSSSKRLNECIQEYTGKTALEFIHDRILIESKRMLRYSSKSAKEIAFAMHFTDAAHFANFFKQKTGFTPMEYKQSKV
jgi:AraC family transcriptional activator of pobA